MVYLILRNNKWIFGLALHSYIKCKLCTKAVILWRGNIDTMAANPRETDTLKILSQRPDCIIMPPNYKICQRIWWQCQAKFSSFLMLNTCWLVDLKSKMLMFKMGSILFNQDSCPWNSCTIDKMQAPFNQRYCPSTRVQDKQFTLMLR